MSAVEVLVIAYLSGGCHAAFESAAVVVVRDSSAVVVVGARPGEKSAAGLAGADADAGAH